MKTVHETLHTPVTHTCDVLVAGGGIGGIAAALAAARQGKRVTLLERGFMLGGLATAGLIIIYLPLCDGYGRQVSFGLAEELLRLSVSIPAKGFGIRDAWSKDGVRTEKDARFEADFNPQLFAILAEQALLKENVTILYDTRAVATAMDKDRIAAVIAENKSGRFAIKVGSVVDATGDADIVHLSGAPTAAQPRNVLSTWYFGVGKDGYRVSVFNEGYQHAENAKRLYSGVDGDENATFMYHIHDWILKDTQKRREKGDTDWQPATIPTTLPVRMTRRIDGAYTLDEAQVHTRFEDSIGLVSDWRNRGPVFEVPFRTLYCNKVKNLLTAGRCTSVTDPMWDIMRVIPCCAVTGEAAGVAAALSDDMTALDVKTLQNTLRRNGVVIHEDELK